MKSGFVIRSTIENLLPGNRETTPEIGLKNLKQTFSTVSYQIYRGGGQSTCYDFPIIKNGADVPLALFKNRAETRCSVKAGREPDRTWADPPSELDSTLT